jgi:hypothetical protein
MCGRPEMEAPAPAPPIIAGATKTVSISERALDENCAAFDDFRRRFGFRVGKSVSSLPKFGSDTVGTVFTHQLRDGPRLCGSGRADAGQDIGSSRWDDCRARMESKAVPCEEGLTNKFHFRQSAKVACRQDCPFMGS